MTDASLKSCIHDCGERGKVAVTGFHFMLLDLLSCLFWPRGEPREDVSKFSRILGKSFGFLTSVTHSMKVVENCSPTWSPAKHAFWFCWNPLPQIHSHVNTFHTLSQWEGLTASQTITSFLVQGRSLWIVTQCQEIKLEAKLYEWA